MFLYLDNVYQQGAVFDKVSIWSKRSNPVTAYCCPRRRKPFPVFLGLKNSGGKQGKNIRLDINGDCRVFFLNKVGDKIGFLICMGVGKIDGLLLNLYKLFKMVTK